MAEDPMRSGQTVGDGPFSSLDEGFAAVDAMMI
jgi:hypothetical protein